MTVLQYMNQTGLRFWGSIPVSLLIGLGEWGTLLFFVRSYGGRLSLDRRGLTLHGGVLAVLLLLQVQHFQVALHCLALLVLCTLYICLLTRCSWFNGVFASSLFCLYVELGKSVCRNGLIAYGLKKALPALSDPGVNLTMLGLYLAYLGLLSLLFRHRHRRRLDLPITGTHAVGLLFPLLLYLAVRLLQYAQVDQLDNRQWFRYDLLQYAVAACSLLVMSTMEGMLSSQIELSELAHGQLLMKQKLEQYELQRETIDFINARWHDMKHYLTGIEVLLAQSGGGENDELRQAEALLGNLRQGIDLYGDIQKTGNPVMDVLLFQKLRECRQKDIRLIPLIDARQTGFISTLDMSVLFGNALDNAIEATQALDNPALREIRVKIGTSDRLLLLRFHNRYQGQRRRDGERYLTTKARTQGHGYGLASIAAIAEKYGGTATVDSANGEFTLHILIPLPDPEQEGATP